MSERARGILYVLAAAVAWSTGGLGVKLVDAPALAVAGLRSAFAAAVLAVVFARAARPRGAFEALAALGRRPLVWGAAAGYAVMVVCFVAAAKLTTVATAILLQYTGPIYVALLSWPLLRERIGAADLAGVATCALGMAIFFSDALGASGPGGARAGAALAVLSSFGFAALPLQIRLEQRRCEEAPARADLVPALPVGACLLGNVLAAAACAPWALAHPPASIRGWTVLAALGVVQIGAAYALYAAGVRRLRAVESSLVATLEPILSPVWAFLGAGEAPGPAAVLGGALIVAGVAAQGLARAPRAQVAASSGASGAGNELP